MFQSCVAHSILLKSCLRMSSEIWLHNENERFYLEKCFFRGQSYQEYYVVWRETNIYSDDLLRAVEIFQKKYSVISATAVLVSSGYLRRFFVCFRVLISQLSFLVIFLLYHSHFGSSAACASWMAGNTPSTSTAKNIGESSNESSGRTQTLALLDEDGWFDGDEDGYRWAPNSPWASPP